MLRLIMPGVRFKRWVLIVGIGIICLLLFFVLAFGKLILLFTDYIGKQAITLFNLSIAEYSPKLIIELILFFVGIIFIALGSRQLYNFLVDTFIPEHKGRIAHFLIKKSQLRVGSNIVVIGGGTGLNSILRGLKNYTNNITAIVSVADEGGSSKRLRTEFGILPPGDIRNCLVALSDAGPELGKLLDYRFREGNGLKGHSFGNLFITALNRIEGRFDKALEEVSKILAIRGKVLPVTLKPIHLCAELENGKIIETEPEVEAHKTKYKSEIKKLFLKPKASAFPAAINAIRRADIIVLGPGSLYTSILPNLLVGGITDAIKNSSAKKAYVCNVMTQPGETDGYTASDHADKIVKYLGKNVLDFIILNKALAPEKIYEKYKKRGAKRVKIGDDSMFEKFNAWVIKEDLMTKQDLLRHDPDKLARTVLGLHR